MSLYLGLFFLGCFIIATAWALQQRGQIANLRDVIDSFARKCQSQHEALTEYEKASGITGRAMDRQGREIRDLRTQVLGLTPKAEAWDRWQEAMKRGREKGNASRKGKPRAPKA